MRIPKAVVAALIAGSLTGCSDSANGMQRAIGSECPADITATTPPDIGTWTTTAQTAEEIETLEYVIRHCTIFVQRHAQSRLGIRSIRTAIPSER
jgi:hypothetical protein